MAGIFGMQMFIGKSQYVSGAGETGEGLIVILFSPVFVLGLFFVGKTLSLIKSLVRAKHASWFSFYVLTSILLLLGIPMSIVLFAVLGYCINH